jgi:hypothetical protein
MSPSSEAGHSLARTSSSCSLARRPRELRNTHPRHAARRDWDVIRVRDRERSRQRRPVDQSGVGSAVINSSRQVGGSIGIALMGAIMAHEIGGRQTPQAFVHGLSIALVVAAAIAVAGALAAVMLVRTHARRETDEPVLATG